ncbi:RNA-binding protein rsd1 [Bienertia sinuspersici]
MQKLDRTGTATSIAGTLGVPVLNSTASVQQPIPVLNGHTALLLQHFLTDPEFDLDIKEDVEEECSKFGPVRHIYVDKYELPTCKPMSFPFSVCLGFFGGRMLACYQGLYFNVYYVVGLGRQTIAHSAGHVYLRFDNKEAAINAQHGMHMRWFARRLISAIFMVHYRVVLIPFIELLKDMVLEILISVIQLYG